MKEWLLFICFLLAYNYNYTYSQGYASNWCFGHNAAMKFNGTNATIDSSSVVSRGSCASISDVTGKGCF